MALTVLQLADKLRDEADAYKFLEDMRWAGEPVCPHCGADRPYFLKAREGERRTRTGNTSQRRVWKCRECRKQFSVLTGTIFHGTKIPVRTWVLVIFEMASSKNGVAAREIERKYGLTPKSAWFMMHRIREAMKREPIASLLSGRVVADETYIGGKPGNRHKSDPRPRQQGWTDKTPVLALVSRDTGEVVTKVLPNVDGSNLAAAIRGEVEVERAVLHTDDGKHYHPIARYTAGHEAVNHTEGEYVRGDVSTNQAEAFFSQLKRSIDGTHHHVSVPHLHRYLAEFAFRYTYRKESDTERMARLVRRTRGRRLVYRRPTEVERFWEGQTTTLRSSTTEPGSEANAPTPRRYQFPRRDDAPQA
jgi:transposase-like protein